MKHKTPTTALLDLGGVVFQSTGVSNETIDWKVITDLNNIYGHDLNIGKDIFSEFMEEYNRRTNQQLSGQVFLEHVFDPLQINQELIDLVSESYKVVIVSDNYRENIDYISRRYHFDQWSENQIYSFDYGMVKGHPLFFKCLLEETGYLPGEVFLIDDSIEKIQRAASHGIFGIPYIDNVQLNEALVKL